MSMNGLQHLVCRGAIDREFLGLLVRSPEDAVRGFDLTDGEAAMVLALRPRSVEELARGVEAWRRGDPLVTQPPVLDQVPATLAR